MHKTPDSAHGSRLLPYPTSNRPEYPADIYLHREKAIWDFQGICCLHQKSRPCSYLPPWLHICPASAQEVLPARSPKRFSALTELPELSFPTWTWSIPSRTAPMPQDPDGRKDTVFPKLPDTLHSLSPPSGGLPSPKAEPSYIKPNIPKIFWLFFLPAIRSGNIKRNVPLDFAIILPYSYTFPSSPASPRHSACCLLKIPGKTFQPFSTASLYMF